jgi:hypothetical protein
MSGLIWAGIGKGIADAGAAIGSSMFKAIDADESEARQDKRLSQREEIADRRIREREEAADKRLIDREVRTEERKRADERRDADIYAESLEAAPGIGDQRRFEKFKADLGPESVMTEEEKRSVFDKYYNQRKVGTDEYADRYLERYSKMKEDVIAQIRTRGGSGGLITQAIAEQRAASEAERAADTLALNTRREDNRESADRAREEIANRRLAAVENRPSTRDPEVAELRRETALRSAYEARSRAKERIAQSFREPAIEEKYGPGMAAYNAAREAFVTNHPELKRFDDQISRLEGRTSEPRPASRDRSPAAGGSSTAPGTMAAGIGSAPARPNPAATRGQGAVAPSTDYSRLWK